MTDIAPGAEPLDSGQMYEVRYLGGDVHQVRHRVDTGTMWPLLYLERHELENLTAALEDYELQLKGYEKVDTTVSELLRGDIIRGLDVAVNVSHVEHTANGGVAVYSIDLGHFATFKQSSFPITILRKIQ